MDTAIDADNWYCGVCSLVKSDNHVFSPDNKEYNKLEFNQNADHRADQSIDQGV